MKLSIEQVRELANLQKKLADAYSEMNFSTVTEKTVHMMKSTFLDTFNTFGIRERDSEEFPYEISTVADNTPFMALLTAADIVNLETTHPEAFEYISKALQREPA